MTFQMPSVTIVIPVYNRGLLVQETVDSVLSQDLPPELMEILVVDDGSTDDTFSILQSLYGQNERVSLFSIPNGGVANARNFGLEKATGELIAFLDHDDLWHPQKLRRQVEVLSQDTRAAVVYSKWDEIDENGQKLAEESWLWKQAGWKPAEGEVLEALLMKNPIVSMSVPLIRTEFLRVIAGFDPQTAPADDWDLWMRLAARFPFRFIDEVLVSYRRHESQQSNDEFRMWRGSHRATLKHWKRMLTHPRRLLVVLGSGYWLRTVNPYYRDARRAVEAGHWSEVKKQFWECWLHFPFMIFTMQWLYLLKRYATKDSRPL
jgi:glycosyltransferase involved in cell wall biosynthesis